MYSRAHQLKTFRLHAEASLAFAKLDTNPIHGGIGFVLAVRAEADILLTDCMRQKGGFAVKRKRLLEIRSRGEKIGAGDRFLLCFNFCR